MILPKSIKIMGRTVTITKSEEIDHDNSLGEWDPATDNIKLKSGINKELLNETFWHEITHAAIGYTGVKVFLNEKQDEAVAQAIGFALADILRNNFNISLEEDK